jgi:hypothetical protein
VDEPRLALVRRGDQRDGQRSAHKSIAALTADLNTWIAAWNDNPRPFVWHETADQILDSLKNYLTNL